MITGNTTPKYRYDCLHFRGYKPCAPKLLCQGCTEYQPWEKKILIIKLGALGDVVRTTPVLFAFRRKYPRAHITWITKSNAVPMLSRSKLVNRVISIDERDNGPMLRLMVEEFDEVHCYDKEDAAIALASLSKAPKKYGFLMNPAGQMSPINEMAEYSFDLGLSDDLKFRRNQKTYQELTYEVSGLDASASGMDPYEMPLTAVDRKKAEEVWKAHGLSAKGGAKPVIGLNTGSGRVFRTKQWLEESFAEVARIAHRELGAQVILLGGEDEDERNRRLAATLGDVAQYPGCGFSILEFAAMVERCDVLVTGDTLAMHLALGVKTPPVVLFGSTCEQEVDLYGMGEKIISAPACAPCYKNECDQPDFMKCMRDISPRHVFEAVSRTLRKKNARFSSQ